MYITSVTAYTIPVQDVGNLATNVERQKHGANIWCQKHLHNTDESVNSEIVARNSQLQKMLMKRTSLDGDWLVWNQRASVVVQAQHLYARVIKYFHHTKSNVNIYLISMD